MSLAPRLPALLRRLTCGLALAPLALGGCMEMEGEVTSRGGAAGTWHLRPDRCASGAHRGFRGVELYGSDPREDTEVVVVEDLLHGSEVLVRVPGQGRMIRLTSAECRVLRVSAAPNGTKVNGIPGITGTVQLDCERDDLGHVAGAVTFSCP